MQVNSIAKVIKDLIDTELDYAKEQKMMKKMKSVLYDRPEIEIPSAYEELCSDKIITMDYLGGATGREFCQYATQEERNRMAESLIYAGIAPMIRADEFIFEYHLGNFVFNNNKLGMTDFGSSSPSVVKGIRPFFDTLWWLLNDDHKSFAESYVTLGYAKSCETFDIESELQAHRDFMFAGYLSEEPILFDFQTSLRMFEYQSKTSPNIGRLHLAPDAFTFMKYYWSLSSVLGALRPNISFQKVIEPLWNEYLASRISKKSA